MTRLSSCKQRAAVKRYVWLIIRPITYIRRYRHSGKSILNQEVGVRETGIAISQNQLKPKMKFAIFKLCSSLLHLKLSPCLAHHPSD